MMRPLPAQLKSSLGPVGLPLSNDQRGNTIVEMVIAIAVISLALVGFLTQALNNYNAVVDSHDRLVASNLAREAIEMTRGLRDSNWLAGCDPTLTTCTTWNAGMSSSNDYTAIIGFDPVATTWATDYAPDTIDACMADHTCQLYWHDATGVYNHSATQGASTMFHRLVSRFPVCASTAECGGDGVCTDGESCTSEQIGLNVQSVVGWSTRGQVHTVVLDDYLYNWR